MAGDHEHSLGVPRARCNDLSSSAEPGPPPAPVGYSCSCVFDDRISAEPARARPSAARRSLARRSRGMPDVEDLKRGVRKVLTARMREDARAWICSRRGRSEGDRRVRRRAEAWNVEDAGCGDSECRSTRAATVSRTRTRWKPRGFGMQESRMSIGRIPEYSNIYTRCYLRRAARRHSCDRRSLRS